MADHLRRMLSSPDEAHEELTAAAELNVIIT